MFINLEDIPEKPLKELEEIYTAHYNSGFFKLLAYANINVHFCKASGTNLWDKQGNKYLDFTSGYGALNIGHNHPSVLEAFRTHLEAPNLVQATANLYNGVLANNISDLTGEALPHSILTNSGTEAVDEAIKMAYMLKKGTILYCTNAFHGKTLGVLSTLGDKSKQHFPTFNHLFSEIPFGDAQILEKTLKNHCVSAFIVEPIQGEGGIIPPPNGYLEKARTLCDAYGAALIFDEIQTGLGRCGSMFCFQQYNAVPDILCLAKSLSGGIIPIGCVSVKENIWKHTYGKINYAIFPTTTFGGNTFASVAAIKTLSILKEENLCEQTKKSGIYAMQQLHALKCRHAIITDIRGNGLFIGIGSGV